MKESLVREKVCVKPNTASCSTVVCRTGAGPAATTILQYAMLTLERSGKDGNGSGRGRGDGTIQCSEVGLYLMAALVTLGWQGRQAGGKVWRHKEGTSTTLSVFFLVSSVL